MANVRSRWGGLSLVQQFALMASIVVGTGMAVLGSFVSAEIEDHVVHNAAAATAFYVNSLDMPYLQDLTIKSTLSEESLRALDNLFKNTALGRQIVSVRIWLPDRRIVYSTARDFIGKTFSVNPKLLNALKGEVAAQFGSPPDEADALKRDLNVPLLEIYVPIHGRGGDNIIAVAAFFTHAARLKAELDDARLESWIAVGGVALLQVILLYGIVWQGNKTIELQRAVLVDARRASVETSERFLRRVGADLHDGPAQLIGLALLRLDTLRPLLAAKHSKPEELEKIRIVLQDCLREIRHLSAGLAPPHLDSLPLGKVLELAVRQHEQRTGTAVTAAIGMLPANMSSLHKVCIYRFVQEGLNNASRHAAGIGQTVNVVSHCDELTIEVADKGPGISPSKSSDGGGLGLAGLRDRVESLGGKFALETELGSGTRLRASFQVADTGAKEV
jgi:signal transduction histidine kinase